MKKWLYILLWIVGVVLLFVFFPLFHIRSLSDRNQRKAAETFDADAFADSYWTELLDSLEQHAVPFAEFTTLFEKDPTQAIESHAKKVGVGSKRYLLLKMSGEIVSKTEAQITFKPSEAPGIEIIIENGPVFGNEVRDASGNLSVSDFKDTRQFNDVAASLNIKIEEDVLPLLFKEYNTGDHLRLICATSLQADETTLTSFQVTPISFRKM